MVILLSLVRSANARTLGRRARKPRTSSDSVRDADFRQHISWGEVAAAVGPRRCTPSQRQAMATARRGQAARLTVPPQRVGSARTSASAVVVHLWRAFAR